MEIYKLKNHLRSKADKLKGKFIDETAFDILITYDSDGYDLNGNLLFRFRKNAIPFEILKSGYEAFKGAIKLNDMRITAAGGLAYLRPRKDGSVSKIRVGNKVFSSVVGYLDAVGMYPFCRKTAFTSAYFEKFKQGIPFVEFVDKKYKELCPEHYARQIAIAKATNRNYRIGDTAFTTVTVNENFQTAVHKDEGDFPGGFGNLVVYREGNFKGAYFCLPEYRVAIDMQNCDILFVDVHRWHGNTPFRECSEEYKRVSFVMYYREYMYLCKQPKEELKRVKQEKTGYYTL
jgi:hypothetical protein